MPLDDFERARLLALEQGSDEWHAGRFGCITASVASQLLSVTDRGLHNFVALLRGDKVRPDISHKPAVAAGRYWEPVARSRAEMALGVQIRQVGLVVHPVHELVRCSPDGLIADDGGCEIKRPERRELHVRALAGRVPDIHVPQVQFSLWCSGRAFWKFVSFRIEEPERYRLAIVHVEPDPAMFRKFEHRVRMVLPYLTGGLTHD